MASLVRWLFARQGLVLAAVAAGGLLLITFLLYLRAELAPLMTLRTVSVAGGAVAETRYNPLAFLVFGVLAITTLSAVGLFMQFVRPVIRGGPVLSGDRVASASATLQRELASALAVMRGSVANSATYTRSLENAQTRLGRLAEAEQVRVVVSLLVAENERMRIASANDKSKIEACVREIDTLQESLRGAEEETLKDALTGIGNRRLFNTAIEDAVEASNTRRTPLSLIMCDIDHFKRVNDKFGHHVGDEIIRALAKVIEVNVRDSDRVARYGGEEFAIILPGTKQQAAKDMAERIRRAFGAKQYTVRKTSEKVGLITASFGVAEHRPGDDLHTFVQRADAKLYEAKARGRDRVAHFDDRG